MNAIPKPKRFSLHRVSFASKAVAEAKRAGVRAHTPKSDGKALLPSYALLNGHVPNAAYIRPSIGTVTRAQLKPLYDAARRQSARTRRRQAKQAAPIQAGDSVVVTKGAFEGITATVSRVEHKIAVLPMPIGEARVHIGHVKRT